MSHCKKPCPGCGQIDRYRASNSVCDKCKHAIANYDEVVSKFNAKKDTTLVKMPPVGCYHWIPYLRYEKESVLKAPFMRLILAVARTVFDHKTPPGAYPNKTALGSLHKIPQLFEKSEGEYVVVELPSKAPVALREMFAAFDVALKDAYAQGRSDGANALERMIRGDLKVEEINAMHVDENR